MRVVTVLTGLVLGVVPAAAQDKIINPLAGPAPKLTGPCGDSLGCLPVPRELPMPKEAKPASAAKPAPFGKAAGAKSQRRRN